MRIAGIYKITSPTGKIYIGQSWDIEKRWKGHAVKSKKKLPIVLSILKYGKKSHHFQVMHEIPLDAPQNVLDELEKFYIYQFKEAGFVLMNLTFGGIGHKGGIPWNKGLVGVTKKSDEAKNKISILHRQGVYTCYFKKNHIPYNKGKSLTYPVWNAGVSGVVRSSVETRVKISSGNFGSKKATGSKMSDNTRRALKEANTGRSISEYSRLKMRESALLNPNRGGTKNKGKIRTEENKKKISDSLKARTDNKGESASMALFTWDIINEIRSKYIPKIYPSRRLAKEYGMSKTNILDIVNFKIWKI